MIPLRTFDFRRVLDGARVPLCWHITDTTIASATDPIARRILEDHQRGRVEWCGNIGWEEIGDDYPRTFFRAPSPAMALDPTHPDVARLIDRRIAEAVRGEMGRWAYLRCVPGRAWFIATDGVRYGWHAKTGDPADGGGGSGTMPHQRSVSALATFPCEPENIPAARAALLVSLYPPESP